MPARDPAPNAIVAGRAPGENEAHDGEHTPHAQ